MYDQKTESLGQTCHSIHRTTGAEPRKSPDYYKPLFFFFFFFCINMQRLGQALGTNSTTQDASVGKACLPCLRPCTRTAFKSEGTICSMIPPMTGKSRKSTFSACQWTPYGVWFLTPPLSNSCTYSFFFFSSATLQGFWDLSSWPRTEAGPQQWKSQVLTPGPQGIPSPSPSWRRHSHSCVCTSQGFIHRIDLVDDPHRIPT